MKNYRSRKAFLAHIRRTFVSPRFQILTGALHFLVIFAHCGFYSRFLAIVLEIVVLMCLN